MNFRSILFINGFLLSCLALAMTVPVGFDLFYNTSGQNHAFLMSMAITGFFGIALVLSNKPHVKIQLGTREAFLTTTLLWITMCLFGGLPFYFSNTKIPFYDACFESVSALTTTGATIFTNLDKMPREILLWRSLLQWIGGIGIVVMALTIFPILRIGGMQLFRSEFSDRSEKILPRVSQIAIAILAIYSFFTLICFCLLCLAGMSFFDALCHAMTAISTGGLSTHDESIGFFKNPVIEMILAIFMFIGGSTLVLYIRLWNKDWTIFQDSQLRVYALFTFFCIFLMTGWHLFSFNEYSPFDSLRHSIFITISFISSTGYVLNDYTSWGSFPIFLIFILSFSGGCTGSTTGGIKIFRLQVLYSITKAQLQQLRRPYGVYIPLYQSRQITDIVAYSVFSFIALYIVSIILISLGLSALGIDFQSSLSASVACLGNIGPGVSKILGYKAYVTNDTPIMAKMLLMFAMILGRLELVTVLIAFMPSFWRD